MEAIRDIARITIAESDVSGRSVGSLAKDWDTIEKQGGGTRESPNTEGAYIPWGERRVKSSPPARTGFSVSET